MNKQQLSAIIDHTCLKASASKQDIIKLCKEAKEAGFATVCVNSCRVSLASKLLQDSPVKVCSVVGFPLGAMSSESKSFETAQAVKDGADEIDMVVSVGHVKEKDWTYVENDIYQVVQIAKKEALNLQKETLVKVILETCYLSDEEIIQTCLCAKKAGSHFVKTSTGFGTPPSLDGTKQENGATSHHVRLMRNTVGKDIGVKASGGIRTLDKALEMIQAGANRLGLSAGMDIIQSL